MRIRKATSDDIDAMTGLLRELFSIEKDFSFDEKKQKKGLGMLLSEDSRGLVFVAEDDGVIAGMCTMQVLISTAEGGRSGLIEDMVVAGPYRGMGVGAQLLKAVKSTAFSSGLKRIQLLADMENAPALKFYENKGLSRTNLICYRLNHAE